jgi:hypothetical protein
MQDLKLFLISLSGVGILFLGACSGSNPTASTPRPATSETTAPSPESDAAGSDGHADVSQGGQVVESGPYHLELVPKKTEGGTHLDFYLQQGETHTAIPDAKVTAQIQLPDGTQKSLNLNYDAEGKHYAAEFVGTSAGEYAVAILSDINGEKVNGRFSFKQ